MSLLIFLFVLGVLIVVHEFGHFITAKSLGVRVEKFSLGFGPRLFKKKINETEYSISAIPLGGYVKLAGDNLEEYQGKNFEYFAQAPGKRFWIIFCGPLLNYLLGVVVLWFIFIVGYPALTTKIGGLADDLGAKAAGVQVGDTIIAIDNQKVALWEELQKIIRSKNAQDEVNLSLLRNNQELTLTVPLKKKEVDDMLGQKQVFPLLGIAPDYQASVQLKHGVGESFFLAWKSSWEITTTTYKALWRIASRKMSVRDSVTGPLGIFVMTSQAAQLGIIPLLHLIAILSLSLAIFNVLPIPILDGGHILFLAIEKIRGKTLSVKFERAINQVGFTLIITLALFATYSDVLRLFGDKIAQWFTK
ncbi:MAG: RIP metalloprotease RseP [Candidatus Omnitrophica bacterium]|nr:RIP metalloprotease RseP [Candidatus Omnitrophota bacterium]